MKVLTVTLNGLVPLLLNSNQGVNPLNPLTIEKKKFTGKRKKTEEDQMKILELSFYQAMYYNEKLGPYIPAVNVEAMLRDAAKKNKKGNEVKMGIRVDPDLIQIQYDGPRKIEDLWKWKDRKFVDVRVGKIQKKSSIMICRPRFEHWKIAFDITFDESIFDEEEIKEILKTSGRYIGICDYRPRYGLFEIIEIKSK